MINNEYQELFKERKWKKALDAMPLNVYKTIQLKDARDILILRTRASEYGREKGRNVSVNIDFDEMQAIVKVTKK